MIELFTAIKTRFDATGGDPAVHNAAYTALGGQLYLHMAPDRTQAPYAVYMLISDVPDWTFTDSHETATIQFSVYSGAKSASEVCNTMKALQTLYNDCTLTVTGFRPLYMQRGISWLLRDEETWAYHVEYDVLLEKA